MFLVRMESEKENLCPEQNCLELILGRSRCQTRSGRFLACRCFGKLPLVREHDAPALLVCIHSGLGLTEMTPESRVPGNLGFHLLEHSYPDLQVCIHSGLGLTGNVPMGK